MALPAALGYALPYLLIAAHVVRYFSEGPLPLPELWRPLAVALVVTALLHLGTLAVVRPPELATLATATLALTLIGDPVAAFVPLLLMVGWIVVRVIGRRRGRLPRRAQLARLVGLSAMVATVLVSLVGIQAAASLTPPVPAVARLTEAARPGGPNLHLILLDGYPRADTLLEEFDFDNGEFLGGLESRGFDVSAGSRSSYRMTWQTVASMLNLRYLDELIPASDVPADEVAQERLLYELINRSEFVTYLKEAGYRVVSTPSPISGTDLYASADAVRTSGAISQLEVAMLRQSLLMPLLTDPMRAFIARNLRDGIEGAIASAATGIDADTRPFLSWTHVAAPHAPYVVRADGGVRPLPPCYPRACYIWESARHLIGLEEREYAGLLIGQVEFVNDRVLEVVDRIVEQDPDGVIIIFSDHGIRFDPGNPEEYRVLFAARAPGREELFGDDISLINVPRRILSEYFGEPLDDLEHAAWSWDDPQSGLLENLEPIPPP
ncbi:MAG TPA: hypothetical protein VHK06_04515 [Candidatus Limnocylindria bacterium]|nr:hypothetical protein [Candidatus Limnocylindria bacterium]